MNSQCEGAVGQWWHRAVLGCCWKLGAVPGGAALFPHKARTFLWQGQ